MSTDLRNHTLPRRLALALVLALTVLSAAALPALAQEGGPGVVNVNQATVSELALLPRVGPAVAERIVAHREDNGEFTAVEDLMLVRGIGEKTFDLLEAYVVVEGETTLESKVRLSDARARLEAEDGRR